MLKDGKDDRQDARTRLCELETLTPRQVLAIDRALGAVGAFGEVRLIKVRGKVRFIQQLKSDDLRQMCEMRD